MAVAPIPLLATLARISFGGFRSAIDRTVWIDPPTKLSLGRIDHSATSGSARVTSTSLRQLVSHAASLRRANSSVTPSAKFRSPSAGMRPFFHPSPPALRGGGDGGGGVQLARSINSGF